MNVSELVKILLQCDPELLVLADHKAILGVDRHEIKSLRYEQDPKQTYINLYQ